MTYFIGTAVVGNYMHSGAVSEVARAQSGTRRADCFHCRWCPGWAFSGCGMTPGMSSELPIMPSSTFWYVLPSLPMFLALPWRRLRAGMGFWSSTGRQLHADGGARTPSLHGGWPKSGSKHLHF